MNCRDVCTWFLSADDPATLPAEVGRHVSACGRCRSWQARVLRLNAEARRAPALPARPAARARFLERLNALPDPSAPPRVRALRRWVYSAAAVAAVLLLAIGLLWLVPAARKKGGSQVVTREPPPGMATKDDVATRLLRRDMALAESFTAPEQLWELAGMARDLREEAIRQVQAESPPDLTLVASLYQRVLRVGIVGRANVLPDDTSRSLLRPLREELRGAADETDRLAAAALPDRAETLRAMSATARDVSESLAEPARADPVRAPERLTAAQPLLEVLVLHGLLLVAEDDPLRRAAQGNEVVGILTEKFRAADAASDVRLVSLSDQFSALLERTVASNLDRADADAIEPERVAEIERARRRADEATDALERNLEDAPPAAREGLEKAVKAVKNKPKDKSKGKEKHLPPGLDKKPQDKADRKKRDKEDH
jgi:hypothetical protein